MIKIYAPASIGNINVGFDILGAAIYPIDKSLLGDCITIKKSKQFTLKTIGQFSHELPTDITENIVWKCWLYFCKKIKKDISVSIILEKNMPIGSGLGSSACSVVATLVGLNNFLNHPINDNELLILMGKLESLISGTIHYDNVAPCYLGGIQLIINEKKYITQKIPHCNDWFWIIAWPGININTMESRNLLPKKYTKKICIDHSRHIASFIHASHTMQYDLAAQVMKDVIAEPYRTILMPQFNNIKQKIMNIGAMSFGISGSGPSIFAICDNINIAIKIEKKINEEYIVNKNGFVKICKIDNIGTKIIG
ncbi:homoserine kinase [Buchnera aphidicola (Thelaxes californica)]|uniref:Homoserine kinase n=1 Tax=Buchnera aphidicola (Thelaxes californica) TaxID=1315998 RepID=A0A4D6YL52_9GAMM|nr:homoserine kinase [Buchnera aphidicola]QCI26704.1 homoserine kinase [Buchnera aphidicola (Thelaxes californica)]